MYNRYYGNITKTVYYNPQQWIDYLWERGITYHPLSPEPDMGQSQTAEPIRGYTNIYQR